MKKLEKIALKGIGLATVLAGAGLATENKYLQAVSLLLYSATLGPLAFQYAIDGTFIRTITGDQKNRDYEISFLDVELRKEEKEKMIRDTFSRLAGKDERKRQIPFS